MSAKYIELLEQKIEQYENELGQAQIYQDYANEIIDLATDGYEKAKQGYKNCRPSSSSFEKGKHKGSMEAYEQIILLVRKWLREFDN